MNASAQGNFSDPLLIPPKYCACVYGDDGGGPPKRPRKPPYMRSAYILSWIGSRQSVVAFANTFVGPRFEVERSFLIHVLKLRWRAFAFAELVKILNWTEFNFNDAYFVWNRTARPVTCARETDDSDWSSGRGELPSDWPITFLKISSRTVQDLNEIIEIFVTRSR